MKNVKFDEIKKLGIYLFVVKNKWKERVNKKGRWEIIIEYVH